jgi:hypothetical protein
MKKHFLKKQLYLEKIKVLNFDIYFYLVNRMSPTKPRTRNTIILRHPVYSSKIRLAETEFFSLKPQQISTNNECGFFKLMS